MLKTLIFSNSISFKFTQLLNVNNAALQQVRTTFVLKRLYPVELHKKNEKPRKLRGKHYNYVMVEDSNTKKQPDVEVVLKQFVSGIGRKGEVVKLRPNYAYNHLLLTGLADYVTPENVEKYKPKLGEDNEEENHSSQFAQRTVNMLQNRVFAIVMNKEQPWVVEPWHIRASLRKCGYYIKSDSSIELPNEKITGPDMMKQNKEFYVTVTINGLEKARVKCRIHHWSTDPSDRLPYVYEHWLQSAEPIIPEDTPRAE
ncbi:hypothetical protein ACKWTF_011247 [Chironomus riparius]